MLYITGRKDSNAGEAIPERTARVHFPPRPEREARTGAAAQTGPAQGEVF